MPAWISRVPRWLTAGLLLGVLSGMTFLVAELSDNWTIAPTAVFLGAMSGPLMFAIWTEDRTRVGRSVAPDVLFAMWLLGGGVAIVFAGFFESRFFHNPTGRGYVWIGLVEETAKVVAPLAICILVPKYRSMEQALAFAVVAAGGFAAFESMTYALYALDDESVRAARRILLERTVATPFAHLPWTGIAVVVAATTWQAARRVRLTPKALWGLGFAIAAHTLWNVALVEGGWWHVLTPIVAVTTFLLYRRLLEGVCYEGEYAIPTDHAVRPRDRDRGA
jgi:protease PrsW